MTTFVALLNYGDGYGQLMKDKYILLADSDTSSLGLQEVALKYFYGGDIAMAITPEEAFNILKIRGRPELIFIEFEFLAANNKLLHDFLQENKYHIPIVSCSLSQEAQTLAAEYPMASAILEKPISLDSFTYLVKGITSSPLVLPSYVPVNIETILEHSIGSFDFYLKLSDTNFVKILNKEDGFSKAHAEKLQSKGIQEIFIAASDSHKLLKIWEEQLKLALTSKNLPV
jgi:hypothetical protein